jgi:uncharacterized membrane protein YedE/YeeE
MGSNYDNFCQLFWNIFREHSLMLANLHPYFIAGLGGILIGLASWLLWWGLGRIAGISGIASETIGAPFNPDTWRWAFLAGLIVGGCLLGQGLEIPTLPTRPLYLLIPAGLLVGIGTVWGSGCTSGHGVCGLGRLSLRSLVSVGIFMATGMMAVTLMRGAA